MVTELELVAQIWDLYGIEVDVSYALNYIDMAGDYAEVNGFYLWLKDLGIVL